MQKGQSFSWPSLQIDQLLSFMHELNFQVTANDFREPVPEIIRNIYEQFAEILLGVGKDELSQLPFEQIQMLEYVNIVYICQILMCTAIMRFMRKE